MVWSHDPPEVEGWFWVNDGNNPEIVRVFKRPGHEYLAIYSSPCGNGDRCFLAVKKVLAFWSGPIPEPTTE